MGSTAAATAPGSARVSAATTGLPASTGPSESRKAGTGDEGVGERAAEPAGGREALREQRPSVARPAAGQAHQVGPGPDGVDEQRGGDQPPVGVADEHAPRLAVGSMLNVAKTHGGRAVCGAAAIPSASSSADTARSRRSRPS